MEDNRRDSRIGVEIEVIIDWPNKDTQISTSSNCSNFGMLTKNPFSEVPSIGTLMTIQLTQLINGKGAPVLQAEVVRASTDSIAFNFIQL
jgi:hypothetical protein